MRRTVLRGVTVAALALGCAGTAQATGGILGISGGANLWFHDPDGEILGRDVEGGDIDLDGDRDWNLWFEWDHILPGIPSVRLERTNLEQEGTGSTVVNLDHTDLTLFWSPIPLPMVGIDVGFTARNFDGEVRTPGLAADDPDTSLSGTRPMFFGRVGVNIPGSRIGFEGTLQTLPVGDHSVTDFRAHMVYRRWYTGAMIGYREFSVDLDDFSDVTLDVDFSGPYAGAFLRF